MTTLTRGYDNFPLWSPRGDLIVFSRQAEGADEIYTIKPDGTSLKRLTFTHGNDAHMAWSPDGEYIAFVSSRMGFKDEVAYTERPTAVRRGVRHAVRRHARAAAYGQPVGGRHPGVAAKRCETRQQRV